MSKKLFSLGADIDEVCARMDELNLLINVLDDEMEEGYPVNEIETWKAINFTKRLPTRHALLRVFQREFEQCIKELDVISTQLMDMSKTQKEATL